MPTQKPKFENLDLSGMAAESTRQAPGTNLAAHAFKEDFAGDTEDDASVDEHAAYFLQGFRAALQLALGVHPTIAGDYGIPTLIKDVEETDDLAFYLDAEGEVAWD